MSEGEGESVMDDYCINNPSEPGFSGSAQSELSWTTVFQVAFQWSSAAYSYPLNHPLLLMRNKNHN